MPKPSKLREQIYSLRHDETYPGFPNTLRPWTEIASILSIPESSVRYNYKRYIAKLNSDLSEQKAQVVAKAIKVSRALPTPRPEARTLTVLEQVNSVIEDLSNRLTPAAEDVAYCGVSQTLLKFLKFKQKYLDEQPEVTTGDEMMLVLVQALSEEEDATKERILNKVIDILGENLTSIWKVEAPGSD